VDPDKYIADSGISISGTSYRGDVIRVSPTKLTELFGPPSDYDPEIGWFFIGPNADHISVYYHNYTDQSVSYKIKFDLDMHIGARSKQAAVEFAEWLKERLNPCS